MHYDIPKEAVEEMEEDNESFLRRYSICEEERLTRTGMMRTGLSGPRWFRSANVICLERVRAMRAKGDGMAWQATSA
jgi:hypothetical protein